MPKRSAGDPFPVALVDDPMLRALIPASGPLLDHVPQVDNIHIFNGLHRDPFLLPRMPHFEAIFPRLLEQARNATEVGVGPGSELTGIIGVVRRVPYQFHEDARVSGETVQNGRWMAQALDQNLPE